MCSKAGKASARWTPFGQTECKPDLLTEGTPIGGRFAIHRVDTHCTKNAQMAAPLPWKKIQDHVYGNIQAITIFVYEQKRIVHPSKNGHGYVIELDHHHVRRVWEVVPSLRGIGLRTITGPSGLKLSWIENSQRDLPCSSLRSI